MASRLLNSGDLKNYFAIGEDGVLVWQRADAFRSSIITSEQLGQKYADYLAVPRFTADGSHVDWFIPFAADNKQGEYSVVAWPAASPAEKRAAMEELNRLNEKFLNYGFNLQARALNANDRLFAHFLTGTGDGDAVNPAIHFPDEECVYIVNGRPVITFWGFLNRGDTLSGDPFTRLRASLPPVAGAAPVKTAVGAAPVATPHKWCWLLLPLLLLLLPLLAYLLWWWFFARVHGLPLFGSFTDLGNLSLEPAQKTLVVPDRLDKEKIVRLDDGTVVKVDGENVQGSVPVTEEPQTVPENVIPDAQQEPVSEPAANEPVAEDPNANQNETPAQEPENPAAQEDNKNADNEQPSENPQDPLQNKTDDNQNVPVPPQLSEDNTTAPVADGPQLSNSDLNSGDITKLDGTWKVNSAIVDKKTNKPIQLEYNFKDGKGTATISQKNGVKCTGNVNGGLSGGALTIQGNSIANCTDGSSYAMPKVVCKPGKDGNSDCTSSYDGKSSGTTKSEFPMTIHR